MGVAKSPENFQQKIDDLFHGFEFIRAYINDLLVLTKGNLTEYVYKLELTLNKLRETNNLNVILKSISSDKPRWSI